MTPYEQFVQRHGGGPAFKEPSPMPAYRVQLSPATYKDGVFSTIIPDPKAKDYTVEATTLGGLEAEVRRLAKEDFKESCTAYVRLPRDLKRKPAGFDRMNDRLHYIEVEPEDTRTEAELLRIADMAHFGKIMDASE